MAFITSTIFKLSGGIRKMGQEMKLRDVVERLPDFDNEDTIYAREPWCEESPAIVAREPDVGGVPMEAARAGMTYFLEIHIAKEVIEGWISSLQEIPSPSSTCRRVIEYAINDA